MSARCHENFKVVECDHNCDKVSEPVLGKTGIIWGRCGECGHTIDIGQQTLVPTTRGPRMEKRFYLGVQGYFAEDNRYYFRIEGGAPS